MVSVFRPTASKALLPILVCAAPVLRAQLPTDSGTTYSNRNATVISDVATSTSTIVVSGAAPVLQDLSLVTSITHTFAADMDITLTSPQGTVVTISTDNGAGNDNVFLGTLFDDDAPTPVTDAIYQNLVAQPTLAPEGALARFRGENPNGTWTLTIVDDLAGDTGSFTWSVLIAADNTAPEMLSTSHASSGPMTIVDLTANVATIEVSGAERYLHELELLTSLRHAFAADLDITLRSPRGTVVTITTDNGAGNDDVFNGTRFFDRATTTVTDAIYTNLTVQPELCAEGAFGAFVGEDPNGTWTLTVTDDLSGDAGTLDSWELRIQSTARNVVPGRKASLLVSKAAFTIDREPIIATGGSSNSDTLTLSGTLPVAGLASDLSGAALMIGLNGSSIAPAGILDAKGKFASQSEAINALKGSFSAKNGAFSVSVTGANLADLLGLLNQDETGIANVEVEVALHGAGLLLARGTATIECAYTTVIDASTRARFDWKRSPLHAPLLHATKSAATELVGVGQVISVSGLLAHSTGQPIVPTGDMALQIGDAAAINLPFASLIIDGADASTVVTFDPLVDSLLPSFSISNPKKGFAFRTGALQGTGLPEAGPEAPLSHVLPIRLSVPTAQGTIEYSTLIELRRKSGTSTSWKR
ncbi:MAG: proprotein convertase P-domain-containing protein [Planctomycetes bacterium]|nr:proprotein convertase P-domain-containing protein [Planctomycetota bacterium]